MKCYSSYTWTIGPEPVELFEVKATLESPISVTFEWRKPSGEFDEYRLYVSPSSSNVEGYLVDSTETEHTIIVDDLETEYLVTIYTVVTDDDNPAIGMFSAPSPPLTVTISEYM